MMSYASIFAFILIASIACSIAEAFTNIKPTHNERRSNTKLDVEPAVIAGAAVAAVGAITWLSGAKDREQQSKYAELEAKEKEYQEERERLAYIEPKDVWKEEELKAYDGSDEVGPLLMAVKGDVFNVWKGRSFYGPTGEYHIMAGRDSTRFLAKNRLEEESEDEKRVELNIAERASLEAWYWTLKNKYQLLGRLEGYDPKSTEM
mmetsp:Transcript_33175/g.63333  ORF Transcript_33175/g.63333 Transcript_33175/m.63333 type:complete len:205 (+) Transcript_33175:1-615(+)